MLGNTPVNAANSNLKKSRNTQKDTQINVSILDFEFSETQNEGVVAICPLNGVMCVSLDCLQKATKAFATC